MKVMITGMAGFIGYHLANSLLDDGHEVVGFDNFNHYYDVSLKNARANNLRMRGVETSYMDLKDLDSITDFIMGEYPDIVMHLAAYAGVRHSLNNPQQYIDNNMTGSQNLITACEEAGVENIVYASSSSVMAGNPMPQDEYEKLPRALNPYSFTKAANEAQFMSSPIRNTVGLRFFTVYGPWGRPDMALFDFTTKIIDEDRIDLYNYGDMSRDFTYIDDIIQGIMITLKHTQRQGLHPNHEEHYNEVFNIAYGKRIPLTDFVDAIEYNLGRKAIRNPVPMHKADAKDTWASIDKLKKLGYNPTTPMKDGVAKFVGWYKEYYNVN